MNKICILLLLSTVAFAANNDIAEQAWEHWLRGDFAEVQSLARQFATDTTLVAETRAKILMALGCVEAMQGNRNSSMNAIEQAFRLYPYLSYSSAMLPPPVWSIYNPIAGRLGKSQDADSLSITIPIDPDTQQTLFVRDTLWVKQPSYERSSAIRSLLLPGWGHLSEGRSKGALWSVAQGAMLASWIYVIIETKQARKDYNSATTDFDAKYERYNDFYRLSWALSTANLGLYLTIQYDFFGR